VVFFEEASPREWSRIRTNRLFLLFHPSLPSPFFGWRFCPAGSVFSGSPQGPVLLTEFLAYQTYDSQWRNSRAPGSCFSFFYWPSPSSPPSRARNPFFQIVFIGTLGVLSCDPVSARLSFFFTPFFYVEKRHVPPEDGSPRIFLWKVVGLHQLPPPSSPTRIVS